MLRQYVIMFVVTAIVHGAIAAYVYLKDPRKLTNVTYALFAVSVCWWTACEAAAIVTDAPRALWLWQLCHVGVIAIPIFFMHFVVSLLGPEAQRRKRPLLGWSYVIGCCFLLLIRTPLFMPDAVPKFSFRSFINPGPLYPWFLLSWVWLATYGLFVLYRSGAGASGLKRSQVTYVYIALLAAYLGGVPNFAPVFNIEIPGLMPFGNFALAVYAFVAAHAILQSRLTDTAVAITRTTVFTTVYLLLIGLPLIGVLTWQAQLKELLGRGWWIWLWIVFALLVTAAHAVIVSVQHRAEARLLREQRRYQTFLLHASEGMTQIRELPHLLNLMVHVMTKAVGLTHASIFLEDPRQEGYARAALRYARGVTAQQRLPAVSPLVSLLKRRRQPLVLEELEVEFGERRLKDADAFLHAKGLPQLHALQASVVVPSFIQDRLIGFLVLGAKRSGRLFTNEDLIVFATLANQAAIAIEHARFYEDERQRQAAVFHAASVAALGTMANSMGHQVNNRFNVVSIIAATQKVKLERLLHQPAIDPQGLRHALTNTLAVFDSLEEEALRGGRIVASLRKLTQPLGEGYGPVSLEAAIHAGVRIARYTAGFTELQLAMDVPQDLPHVLGDLTQLSECFLNLLDNAHDAITLQREHVKPERHQGSIHIKASALTDVEGRWIVCEVTDNGIGMTEKERAQLFVPFFTTKPTTEKGFGLGLYVIQNIIGAHRGTMTVHSTYRVGSTFTIRLPAMSGPIARSS